jgi:hypothetical protein
MRVEELGLRKKRLLGLLTAAGATALAASLLAPAPAPDYLPTAKPEAHGAPAAGDTPFATLPARETIRSSRGELFSSRDWAPPKPAPPIVSAPPTTPEPPPMPYRVAGRVVHDGKAHVVLARDDRVFMVQEGDTLDGGYRV